MKKLEIEQVYREVDEGGKSLTVEVVPPSGPAAAFVRIVIPSVNG